PWRKRPGFQTNATDRFGQAGKAFANILRMAGNGAFSDNMASIVDDTNSSLFQRYIQSDIVVHGGSPSGSTYRRAILSLIKENCRLYQPDYPSSIYRLISKEPTISEYGA
ncbi:MAG: hypothetical protein KDJ63_14980, partial [Nitratireductor sp.]|nr:hypothetical protein [Nitratireductor sp.]